MKAATTKGFPFMASPAIRKTKSPHVRSDEILVEVHASSVNPKDWKVNQNLSSIISPFSGCIGPLILGDDLAGVVVAKGKDVKDFEVGDDVYGMTMSITAGTCAEYCAIPHNRAAIKPRNINFVQAACAPLAALTALQAFRLARVTRKSKVLIIGASGGVGTFAVQIAKAQGIYVTAVCSGKNIDLVKKLGADVVIDYTTTDYTLQNGNFDMIFDAVSCQSLQRCESLLNINGVYVTTGGNAKTYIDWIKDNLLFLHKKSKIFLVHSNRNDLEIIKNYIEEGSVTPVIDCVYPLEEMEMAYVRSKTGHAAGKIAIQIRP